MIHQMKLVNSAFTTIKNQTKTIEMRLNDEKRKLINVGDRIEFINIESNEKIMVLVKKIHKFSSFEKLYENFDKTNLGYNSNEEARASDMKQFYSEHDIRKYGVVGIEIEVL